MITTMIMTLVMMMRGMRRNGKLDDDDGKYDNIDDDQDGDDTNEDKDGDDVDDDEDRGVNEYHNYGFGFRF